MTPIVIVSLVFLFGLTLGAAIIWYILRRRETVGLKEPEKKKAEVSLTFHWKHIVLPVAILLLSIVLASVFYPQLTDQVAWRFNLDGSAKGWLSRQMITLLMLLPQFLLVLAASAITWGITKMSRSLGQIESVLKPERFILLMGNMAALPQIVLAFVMLDIFSYNVYGRHLMPIWLFALIVIVAGGIILTILFIRTIKLSRGTSR